jgi:translation initiation factor IF-3
MSLLLKKMALIAGYGKFIYRNSSSSQKEKKKLLSVINYKEKKFFPVMINII